MKSNPKKYGVIVRTAGANKTKNEIEKDFQIHAQNMGRNKEKQ